MVDEKNDSPEGTDLKRALFTVSDAVLGAAVLLALGVYGGAWLDKQFNCSPTLSIGLALLGGGLGLARMVMKANALGSIKDKKPMASGTNATNNLGHNKSASQDAAQSASAAEAKPSGEPGPAADGKVYDTTKQRLPFEDFE